MMPAGTYTAPMQPTTTYAAPGTTTTYPVYTYRAGPAGTVYQTTTPVYTTTAAPATTTYGTPVQGYTTIPAQTTYAPVRRRFPFGLFQRWRQQATPTYTTMPGYNSPVYTYPTYTSMPTYTTGLFRNRGVQAGNYVMGGYTSPYYFATTYAVPAGTMPAGVVTNTVAPTTTTAQPTAPVYTPTTLTVPNSPANASTPASGTGPATAAADDAAPVPSVPTNPPGAIRVVQRRRRGPLFLRRLRSHPLLPRQPAPIKSRRWNDSDRSLRDDLAWSRDQASSRTWLHVVRGKGDRAISQIVGA